VRTKHLVTLAALLVAGAALAQDEPAAGAGRPARDEAFRMVDAYVVSNLQESLGLTDEQFAKAIPLVKKLQSERREYFVARRRALREMRRLLQQGGATESQVLELLKEVRTLDAEGPEKTRRNLAALDALLTPIQQAKYRVLEIDVEQRMQELLNRARAGRPAGREGTRPPPQ
jgi:Spy/CpxP family protein refolding chaperone